MRSANNISSKVAVEKDRKAFCNSLINCETKEQLQLLLNHPQLQYFVETDPRIRLYLAREFVFQHQYQIARNYLQTIEPPLSVEDAYWYWNSYAMLAAHFVEPFEEAFKKARDYCSGHEFGVLWINQGWAYHGIQNTQAALECWKTALVHIRFPSIAMALVDYNIGQVLLERLDPSAEYYFQRMQQVTRHAVAEVQRPAAFLGLGDWHRVHGRLKQARFFYKRALKTATGFALQHAQIDAHAKLGFVCVLEEKLEEAKTHLEAAKQLISETDYAWVYTIEAFLYIKTKDLTAANRVLNTVQNLSTIGFNRAQVLSAELERRLGHEQKALEILQTLDVQNIGARELMPRFPGLFTLALEHGLQVEAILEKQRHVVVQTLGRFCLVLDGRVLELPKGCDELLVYFLYYGTREADEAIEALFWEELKKTKTLTLKKARARFNTTLKRLRDALQWHDVIQRKGNEYVVNHEGAIWRLDWKSVSRKQLQSQFLMASERQWVQDIRDND
jgi:tetratricopeptide (TPR) repeat protein